LAGSFDMMLIKVPKAESKMFAVFGLN